MNKLKTTLILVLMITISVSVSHNGATAEERKNSQQDEFKGTNVRSHGHPIANLSDSIIQIHFIFPLKELGKLN